MPVLERYEQRLFGRDVMFSKPVQPECYTAVVQDATVDEVRRDLVATDNVFPANAATIKYRETPEGGLRAWQLRASTRRVAGGLPVPFPPVAPY